MAPTDPHRITLPNGKPGWLWPDGRMHPVVSGGIDDGGSDDDGDDPNFNLIDDDDDEDVDEEVPAKVREVLAKERKARREAEKRERAAARRIAEFEDRDKSETDRAVDAARDEGRKAALAETGQRLAAAEIRAALKGVVPDPRAIVEDLNLSKYVTDDGDVDEKAVKALAEKYATFGGSTRQPSFDGGAKDKDAPSGGSFLAQAIRNKRSA